MEPLPQLIMRINLERFTPLPLGEAYEAHTHTSGNEQAWEEIIEGAFGTHFDFDFLIKAGGYAPEHVFYIRRGGLDLATTTAVENPAYPGEGWLRMVGVRPGESGKGLGKAIVSLALASLRERGYQTAVLSTDDERIPALCTYLSLGFRPVYTHKSHQERWQRLKEILPERFAELI
jgi:GNAT superfamily N-acetyltransferase